MLREVSTLLQDVDKQLQDDNNFNGVLFSNKVKSRNNSDNEFIWKTGSYKHRVIFLIIITCISGYLLGIISIMSKDGHGNLNSFSETVQGFQSFPQALILIPLVALVICIWIYLKTFASLDKHSNTNPRAQDFIEYYYTYYLPEGLSTELINIYIADVEDTMVPFQQVLILPRYFTTLFVTCLIGIGAVPKEQDTILTFIMYATLAAAALSVMSFLYGVIRYWVKNTYAKKMLIRILKETKTKNDYLLARYFGKQTLSTLIKNPAMYLFVDWAVPLTFSWTHSNGHSFILYYDAFSKVTVRSYKLDGIEHSPSVKTTSPTFLEHNVGKELYSGPIINHQPTQSKGQSY